MSKKSQRKMDIRIDDATKAIISVLNGVERRIPGSYTNRAKTIEKVIEKVAGDIENSDLIVYDELAIPAPDESFLDNHWKEICQHAARDYKKYIVWKHHQGIKLGTLEEYQDNQHDLAKIARGEADSIEDRTHIIEANGGTSFYITISIKQLPPGNIEIEKLDLPSEEENQEELVK